MISHKIPKVSKVLKLAECPNFEIKNKMGAELWGANLIEHIYIKYLY